MIVKKDVDTKSVVTPSVVYESTGFWYGSRYHKIQKSVTLLTKNVANIKRRRNFLVIFHFY